MPKILKQMSLAALFAIVIPVATADQISFANSGGSTAVSAGVTITSNVATSSARTVTVSNRQSVALNISGIGVSAGFAIASNTCGTSLGAGANCTVAVTFSPAASGAVSGTLTFTDDAPNSPQTVNLTGGNTSDN